MARQIVTLLTDDLDGSEAAATHNFAYDGYVYEIDLSEKNGNEFQQLMQKYITAGTRKARLSPTGGVYSAPSNGHRGIARNSSGVEHPNFQANKELNARIRAWAEDNGYHLNARGRIAQHIVNAYHQGVPAKVEPDPDVLFTPQPEPEPEPEPELVKTAPAAKKDTVKPTRRRTRTATAAR